MTTLKRVAIAVALGAAKRKAQVVPTTGYSNGKPVFGTTVVPGQVAYLCDDGVTYWR